MTKNQEALSCPHCGDAGALINDPQDKGRNVWAVLCSCGMRGPILPDRAAAIAAWNSRASAARLATQLQKIEAWLTNTCDCDGHPIAGLNIFAENMGGFTVEVMRESVYETAHSAETLADVFSSVAAALGEPQP